MTPALELVGVTAAYGRIQVLHSVSLTVPRGSVVALLGPNGAGKSTTLKVASGQLRPTSGHVHVSGHHLDGTEPADALVRAGLCTVPEGRGIFPNLTVTENLRLVTYAGGRGESEIRQASFARFPRLAQRRTQLAGRLSGGEQQMLAMARALASGPALLLLDELSMGLAPLVVAELYEVVAQLAADGISVLVVEQFASTALAVADYAVVMVRGRVVAVGEPADLRDELSSAYLGGAA
jgi:branched-chain amino acid transport system ATP-binding protein